MNEFYFVSHANIETKKFEELQKKDLIVAKNYSCKSAIAEYLKDSNNKIYVIFVQPVEFVWLAYCKLAPYKNNKNFRNKPNVSNYFEFSDRNNLVRVSFFKM